LHAQPLQPAAALQVPVLSIFVPSQHTLAKALMKQAKLQDLSAAAAPSQSAIAVHWETQFE
jgi:hypothetical protein